ncbi:MAG: 50S ribosomal protein L18Ae [Candidatus Micrarchaeia archaeon]
MEFEVYGKMRLKSEERKFSVIISAKSEKHAQDKALAFLSGKYGIERSLIKIENVKGV